MGRIRSKTSVVCDAGPIIHLDELDCLYLMEDFERVFVPDIVRKEVQAYIRFFLWMREKLYFRAS